MNSTSHLTPKQKLSIEHFIDRDMGKRAGKGSIIFVLFLASLFYLSDQARNSLPTSLIPILLITIAALGRPFLGAKLAMGEIDKLSLYSRLFLGSTFLITGAWSTLTVIFLYHDPTSSVSTIFLIASVALTAWGMGTLTQRISYWRVAQGLLWIPILLAMTLSLSDAKNEIIILTIYIAIFAIFSTRIGDQVCREYWQAQVLQIKLFTQAKELAQAKLKIEQQAAVVVKHRDSLEDMVQAQTSELLLAIEEVQEANIAKDVFLANMSHELRTPMHAIINFASIGIRKAKNDESDKVTRYFEKIHDSGERLMRLLNNLLHLAKLESGTAPMTFFRGSLTEIATAQISQLQSIYRNRKVTLSIHPEESNTSGEFDAEQIGRVIGNLLSNALSYTESGGSVEMEISTEGDSEFNLDQPFLQVSIRDHGIGIPKGEESLVFDRFVQSSKTATEAGGVGLGLAICQEIIIAHKGLIWASNISNERGALFQFQIPVNQELPENQRASS